MMDTPQADRYSGQAGNQRYPVSTLIAIQTVPTIPLPIWQNYRMPVVNVTVDEVKDIAKKNWGQRHTTPVLA